MDIISSVNDLNDKKYDIKKEEQKKELVKIFNSNYEYYRGQNPQILSEFLLQFLCYLVLETNSIEKFMELYNRITKFNIQQKITETNEDFIESYTIDVCEDVVELEDPDAPETEGMNEINNKSE